MNLMSMEDLLKIQVGKNMKTENGDISIPKIMMHLCQVLKKLTDIYTVLMEMDLHYYMSSKNFIFTTFYKKTRVTFLHEFFVI